MLGTRTQVTRYQRQHRRALLDLAFSSPWTHKQLDWYEASDWTALDDAQIFLAWQGKSLAGYLGLSGVMRGHAWIRLLGIRHGAGPFAVLQALWRAAEAHCHAAGTSSAAILITSGWLAGYVPKLGFAHHDDIVTLNHVGALPPLPRASVIVTPAELEHLPAIIAIDKAAFRAPWQLPARDLRQAFRQATVAAIAQINGGIAGYQFTTRHHDVGHLARLAVAPAHQGVGVASALLHSLLDQARGFKLDCFSVNTQRSNLPSLRLYQRFGFVRSGPAYQVWRKRLDSPERA